MPLSSVPSSSAVCLTRGLWSSASLAAKDLIIFLLIASVASAADSLMLFSPVLLVTCYFLIKIRETSTLEPLQLVVLLTLYSLHVLLQPAIYQLRMCPVGRWLQVGSDVSGALLGSVSQVSFQHQVLCLGLCSSHHGERLKHYGRCSQTYKPHLKLLVSYDTAHII